MTSNFKEITDRINNTNDNETRFMKLGDLNTETKKWFSTLWFDTGDAQENKLRLQLPSCYTKSGIIETAGKTYTDLMFDNSDKEVTEMVNLFLTLETESAKQLHERSDEWFAGGTENMTREEFEDMITSLVRLVNRQTNVCVRVNIPTLSDSNTLNGNTRSIKHKDIVNNQNNCQIYNKKSETRQLSDIKADTLILPLVEIKELRISSTSINLHVELIECMLLKESDEKQQKVIRRINLDKNENEHNENKSNENKCENESQTIENNNINDVVGVVVTSNIVNDNDKHDDDNHDENENEGQGVINVNNRNNNDDDKKQETERTLRDIHNQLTTHNDVLNSDIDDNINNKNDNKTMQTSLNDNNPENLTNIHSNNNINDKNHDHDNNLINENENENDEDDEDDGLMEIKDFTVNEEDTVVLKKPDEVYKEIYKAAITKAKKLRQVALEAYLDAKKIKAKFMLEDIYDSDDDDEDEDEDLDNNKFYDNIDN